MKIISVENIIISVATPLATAKKIAVTTPFATAKKKKTQLKSNMKL
jgi:hypothetical protein